MMIAKSFHKALFPLAATAALGASGSACAAVFVQCGPNNQYVDNTGKIAIPNNVNNVACKHLTAGDGFITMADGRNLYTFGFADVSSKPASQIMLDSLEANFAAPTIELKAGRRFLPVADQRVDGDAARPVRPAHGALPRLPAAAAGV